MYLDIDLHTHSLASDGSLSPSELMAAAAESGLRVIALTDHDETGGCAEAASAAAEIGIEFIAGVEISVTWERRTLHIVGLQIDPGHIRLNEGLQRARDFRNWRAEEMGRRLAKHGIHGAYEDAAQRAKGRIISRTHFAQFLAENGYAKDVGSVFQRFLKPNKPGYVSGEWASLEEAVGWIQDAGGLAVIAHPARYKLTATKLRKLIGEFKECGGVGLEVISGSHSQNDRQHMTRVAQSHALLASAGSDFHDPNRPWNSLGRQTALPDGVAAIWSAWGKDNNSYNINIR